MGQGLSPARARPEARVFWKARSPTFGEGPKPGQARSPTFGEGPENFSFLTIVHSKISRPVKARGPAFMEGLKPEPGPSPTFKARARPGPVLLGPDPSLLKSRFWDKESIKMIKLKFKEIE